MQCRRFLEVTYRLRVCGQTPEVPALVCVSPAFCTVLSRCYVTSLCLNVQQCAGGRGRAQEAWAGSRGGPEDKGAARQGCGGWSPSGLAGRRPTGSWGTDAPSRPPSPGPEPASRPLLPGARTAAPSPAWRRAGRRFPHAFTHSFQDAYHTPRCRARGVLGCHCPGRNCRRQTGWSSWHSSQAVLGWPWAGVQPRAQGPAGRAQPSSPSWGVAGRGLRGEQGLPSAGNSIPAWGHSLREGAGALGARGPAPQEDSGGTSVGQPRPPEACQWPAVGIYVVTSALAQRQHLEQSPRGPSSLLPSVLARPLGSCVTPGGFLASLCRISSSAGCGERDGAPALAAPRVVGGLRLLPAPGAQSHAWHTAPWGRPACLRVQVPALQRPDSQGGSCPLRASVSQPVKWDSDWAHGSSGPEAQGDGASLPCVGAQDGGGGNAQGAQPREQRRAGWRFLERTKSESLGLRGPAGSVSRAHAAITEKAATNRRIFTSHKIRLFDFLFNHLNMGKLSDPRAAPRQVEGGTQALPRSALPPGCPHHARASVSPLLKATAPCSPRLLTPALGPQHIQPRKAQPSPRSPCLAAAMGHSQGTRDESPHCTAAPRPEVGPMAGNGVDAPRAPRSSCC